MIFPSTFDTAGVVKVEAAAHKKAGIFIKGSCSAELVEDKVNGFLCEENVESLTDGILELIDKEEYLKQIGEKAYQTLYKSWDMLADEVLVKYQKVIEEYKEKQRKFQRRKELLKIVKKKKKSELVG